MSLDYTTPLPADEFRFVQPQTNGLPAPIQMRPMGLPAPGTEPVYLPVIDSRYGKCQTCSLLPDKMAYGEVLASVGAEYRFGGMMIVGEAPGKNEVENHKPFVGQAGRVLDWLLTRLNLPRTHLIISNAILCRPPNNEIDKHPYAIEHCNSRLFEEVDAYKPRVIVALGTQAVRALIGKVVNRTKMTPGSCDTCDGKGSVQLGNATWMKEASRYQRARKLALTLEDEIACMPCKGKGRRNYKRQHGTLTTDRGVMDLAGAIIDIHNDPQWEHLRSLYPDTKYIVATYHPSFLMRERDRKKGTPGGTYFMPYALRHLTRAKRLLTEEFVYHHAPFILDAAHPAAAQELATFLAPAEGVLYTIDIETEPMPTVKAAPVFPHSFSRLETIDDETGETVSAILCERCNAPEGSVDGCMATLDDDEEEETVRLDPLMEQINCVGIGRSDSHEVCVLDTRGAKVTWPAMEALRDFLEDENRSKCFHNGAFDTAVLEARFSGLEAQPLEFQLAHRDPVMRVRGYRNDTMILAKNIWPDVVKGAKGSEAGIPLDWVAHTYTDCPPWKPKKKAAKAKGGRPIFESFEQLALYNSRDVKHTQDACFSLWDEAFANKIRPEQVQLDIALQTVAVDMQRIGLPIDHTRLDEIKAKCSTQVHENALKVAELAGKKLYHQTEEPEGLKIDSPPQLQKVLFSPQHEGGWGLAPSKMNKGRNGVETPSTAFDVLQGLRNHPGVAALLEVRRLNQVLKLISSWEYMIRDGFLHPSWRAAATLSGRFTSKPNAQNWPNNIPGVGNLRSIVKAPPGWLLVGADYAGLEQRIMGALTGGKLFEFVNRPDATTDDEKFNPDIDCHSFVCAKVFGGRFLTPELYLKPEQLAQGPEAIAKFCKAMKKTLRNDTKRVVYARNYGSGIDTIWEIVREEDPECPRDKIVGIVSAYDLLFPELPKYRERVYAEALAQRMLFSPILGRRKAWPWGEISPTEAANAKIQSCAADIVNLRTMELLKHLPQNCHLILQVHDSLTVLCPAPMAEDIKKLMNEILPCRFDLGHGPMFFDAAAQIGESWDKT